LQLLVRHIQLCPKTSRIRYISSTPVTDVSLLLLCREADQPSICVWGWRLSSFK